MIGIQTALFKPLKSFWGNRDEPFLDIATSIRTMVGEKFPPLEFPPSAPESPDLNFERKRSLRDWLLAAFAPDEFANLTFHSTLFERRDLPECKSTPRKCKAEFFLTSANQTHTQFTLLQEHAPD